MNVLIAALLSAVSVFDYPGLQPRHEELKARFIESLRADDAFAMRRVCRKAVELFPTECVWRYNLACSYSKSAKITEALDALEKAIRLGFRNANAIREDPDLKPLAREERFKELLELAERLTSSPLLAGPMDAMPAKSSFGRRVVLGAHNLSWDFDAGAFSATVDLEGTPSDGNAGDLYMNRDRNHSALDLKRFPSVTPVVFDSEGVSKGVDVDFPNTFFNRPVFGNCSRALVAGPLWRSIPRALMTNQRRSLALMEKFYLSNQVWVFPAVFDCPPAGTNGDVFASSAPYWVATQGKSWSDQYYLRAALEISRSLKPEVKKEIVTKGLLAPTVQSILRKSLKNVSGEDDYLTHKAHPTAFPANGLDLERLKSLASGLETESVPPVAKIVTVGFDSSAAKGDIRREVTYASSCAWGIVLRQAQEKRSFAVSVAGADEYAFRVIHGDASAASVRPMGKSVAFVTIDRNKLGATSRVDIGIFGKTKDSGWGAPSIVSFAVVEPRDGYVDPVLLGEAEKVREEAK